jgi:cell division protein FtsB
MRGGLSSLQGVPSDKFSSGDAKGLIPWRFADSVNFVMQTVGRNTFETIKRAALPALAILIIANFLGYAIVGANGILSWGDYRRQKAERLVELSELNTEKMRLAHRSALLDPRGADPDMVEETVKRELGVVRPDEVVIPLD